MSGHTDAHEWSALVQALIWTVGTCAADPTFRAGHVLISRHVHALLDGGMIEGAVVCAACDRRNSAQVGDDRFGAIVPIQAEKRARQERGGL